MFSSYLSNGEESKEKDHGNEFKESKNGGREVWVGLEWPKNEKKNRRPTVEVVAPFAGPIRARPAAVGREIWPARLPGGGTPTWVARASRGWPETSPMAKTRLA